MDEIKFILHKQILNTYEDKQTFNCYSKHIITYHNGVASPLEETSTQNAFDMKFSIRNSTSSTKKSKLYQINGTYAFVWMSERVRIRFLLFGAQYLYFGCV